MVGNQVSFPWVVHIEINPHYTMMGGVLITDKHVLTADDFKLRNAKIGNLRVVYMTTKLDPDDPQTIPSSAKSAKVQKLIYSGLPNKDTQIMILILGKA